MDLAESGALSLVVSLSSRAAVQQQLPLIHRTGLNDKAEQSSDLSQD